MRHTRSVAAVLLFGIALSGCASGTTQSESGPSSLSPPSTLSAPPTTAASPTTAAPSPAATVMPEPEPVPTIICTTTSLIIETFDSSTEVSLSDGPAVLQLVENTLGTAPDVFHDDGFWDAPWGSEYEFGPSDTHVWPGLSIWVHESPPGAPDYVEATCALTGPSPDSVALTTAAGIRIGSSVDEILAVGGVLQASIETDFTYYRNGYESPFDRYLIDPHDVPNTRSLVTPGAVGRIFQVVYVKNGVAIGIEKSDDFRDI